MELVNRIVSQQQLFQKVCPFKTVHLQVLYWDIDTHADTDTDTDTDIHIVIDTEETQTKTPVSRNISNAFHSHTFQKCVMHKMHPFQTMHFQTSPKTQT